MKSCEEMVNSLLERREQYLAERKSRKEIAVSSAVCCLAAAGVVGIIIWQSGKADTSGIPTELPSDNPAVSLSSDNASENSSGVSAIPDNAANNTENRDYNIVWADSPVTTDNVPVTWNGKWVHSSIPEALHNLPENSKLAISVDIGKYDSEFVYKGKTLEEYANEAKLQSDFCDKLSQLLKEGEELKYGEALYQTGAPDGVKWTKELYEDRVEFYGEELLSKYIVDGVFREINAAKDLENALYGAQNSEIEHLNAVYAYLEHLMSQVTNIMRLEEQGIDVENNMTIFVSESEFEALTFEGIENCVFYPASRISDEPQDFVVPE